MIYSPACHSKPVWLSYSVKHKRWITIFCERNCLKLSLSPLKILTLALGLLGTFSRVHKRSSDARSLVRH